MKVKRIEEFLPEFFRKFLPDFFKNSIPEETAANCGDCPMLQKPGNGDLKEDYYSSLSKCCTHYPNLPNYLIGGLLNDNDTALDEGRHRIRKMIESRIEVTPRGILRPHKYFLLLTHTQKEAFGRSERLICPYYDREWGKCTIHPFWNATCNTWFCKYEAGCDGMFFWITLRKYLKSVEDALIFYTLYKMGWNPSEH
ncbi:MAG TPA: hypothetical protein VMZ04_00625, partial [Anaerolineae bacterium]|nr:hypothetical protein [Anaerolineae bacterium]